MTSFGTKRHERHSLSGWGIIRSRQLDHWTGLRGDLCGTPGLKRKRRRRAEDEEQYPGYCRVGSTVDTGCRRRQRDQVSAPPVLGTRGGRFSEEFGKPYGEANKARTRAGHRAIDGTLLRRNASEVGSYLGATAEYDSFSLGLWAQEHSRSARFWTGCGLEKRSTVKRKKTKKRREILVAHFTTCFPGPVPVVPSLVRVECEVLLGTRLVQTGKGPRGARADVRRRG